MTKLSPGLTVSKAMRAGRSSKATLRCRAESGSQHQSSLHSDLLQVRSVRKKQLLCAFHNSKSDNSLCQSIQPSQASRHHPLCSQGLRLAYDMMEAKTKATALQNSALHAGKQQDAPLISELRDAVEELTGTAAKQAAIIAAQTATTDCQSSVNKNRAQVCCCLCLLLSCNNRYLPGNLISKSAVGIKIFCLQGLRLSDDMLGAKLRATALQNDTLVAGRQQDAVRMQHLVDADTQLRATIAQQAVTIPDQAEAINRQKTIMAQSDRCLSITSKLLSKRWGRRKVEAIDLDHLASHSHVELLKSEKHGLQKTLEETEDELAKERQRTERAWAQAQHRATKRQEAQVHTQVCLSLAIPACS